MDDSFLGDLDMISKEKPRGSAGSSRSGQYITTRSSYSNTSTPNPPTNLFPKVTIVNQSQSKPEDRSSSYRGSSPLAKSTPISLNIIEKSSKITPKQAERKSSDPKPKVTAKIMNSPIPEQNKPEEIKSKWKVLSNKVNNKEPIKQQRSSSKESSQSSDASSKENSQPSGSPIIGKSKKESSRGSNVLSKKNLLSDAADLTSFLNAIKDIISKYTKAETKDILSQLQEMQIASYSNLLKQLMLQTEDIMEELKVKKDSNKLILLVRENERLKEDLLILQVRNDYVNEELKKTVSDATLLREENCQLKLKLKELMKGL